MYADYQESDKSRIWRKQVEALAKYIKFHSKCSQDEAWREARAWLKVLEES